MSSTSTYSTTFTITNARYVTSKVKTDLKLLQLTYGSPGDARIEDFGEEAAQLLNFGYLGTVTYGFRRGDQWIVAMRYTAGANGTIVSDDRAGGIPRGVDISGAGFHSYLTHSAEWYALSQADRDRIEGSLPVIRVGAPEPGTSGGYWTSDRAYSSNGTGVSRGMFKSL